MKKVVDWTFGSIFRTFGRIIAYLIFGIAISYILHSLDFRITDLFLDEIKADTLTYNEIITYYSNSAKTTQLPFPSGTSGVQYYELTGTGSNIETALIYTSRTFVKDTNTKYIRIPFMVTGNTWSTNANFTDREVICEWYEQTDSLGNPYYEPYNCRYWGTGTYSSPADANIKINVSLYSTSGTQTPCIIEEDNIKCELLDNQVYNAIYFKYSQSQITQNPVRLNFNRGVNFYTDNTQEIINNQNQNTQQIIEQQQNNTQQILDSNTTQAESDAEGFFGDFDVPDVGGLSAIITAPLNTIRSLLSSSCSELVLPLPYVDEDLRLPCMNSIYTEHFGLFFSLYQTIILAIIAYRCIRSIYFDITGFTNPDDDRIEVMDL